MKNHPLPENRSTSLESARETIGRIIARTMGAPIVTIRPIVDGGHVNQVFMVLTDSADLIVRLDPSPYALQTYQKEAWCIDQAAARGVPGPDVIALGEQDAHAFMVQNRVPGTVATAAHGDRLRVWRQLGAYAARINSIPVTGYGFVLSDPATGRFRDTWQQVVDYAIGYIFDDDTLLRHRVLTSKQLSWARRLLEEMVNWRFAPALTHANLTLKNAIVGPDGGVTLIDWGTAQAHRAPHLELAELRAWDYNPEEIAAFCEGCGISQRQSRQMQRELDILALLRVLDAVKWADERRHPNLEGFCSHARKMAARVLPDPD
jgi:fructosamine-3-kinase